MSQISWSKLELKKASTVRKEIQDAIKIFDAALSSKDQDMIDSIRSQFELRIEELEEFFTDNDDDDRAVLFKKQEAELRKALQKAPTSAPMHKPTPTKSSNALMQSTHYESPTIKTPAPGFGKDITPQKASWNSGTSLNSSRMVPGGSSTKKKKTPTKPLYSWEKGPTSPKNLDRTPISSDHGEFIPSIEDGFYEKRNATPSSTKFIDFQLIMTAENYEEMMKRRRKQKADLRHTARFANKKVAETPYLNASTPYVDQKAITGALYRGQSLV
ncbi:hypothetical protein TL16_g06131 [Triparma laevis f. inornata]|uniref:Uncharacterized protein n=2 Tax=Triparma laevis TaxID=1534972 RepID=A0A9W7FCM6_9STRA|nr:hypothetical protein TL16_g06131 [Triparma laevis f. inornata]GMI09702.1 hypothetical protein TrLO_g5301 [Triparma laevis f. longispina]